MFKNKKERIVNETVASSYEGKTTPDAIHSRVPLKFTLKTSKGKDVLIYPTTTYGVGQDYSVYITKVLKGNDPETDPNKELSFFFNEKDMKKLRTLDRRTVKFMLNEILVYMGFGEESKMTRELKDTMKNLDPDKLQKVMDQMKSQ